MVQFNTAWCSLPQHGVLNIRPEGPKQQATRTLIAGVFKKPSLETAAIRDQQLFSVHTGPTAVWCSYGTNSCLVFMRDRQLFGVHTGPTAVWCSYGTDSCLVFIRDQQEREQR